ncbi:Uncharacterised protein [Chryseobacterium indoltheticum]|uniref:Uncharacterized protein n=1 Tax=Chryseobacterium indoltheticum TaxID=254 RepID=A0A381FPS2_9FLAO|nr:Uncharacterised protein [Chryseobacterium indoltheticum]
MRKVKSERHDISHIFIFIKVYLSKISAILLLPAQISSYRNTYKPLIFNNLI